MIDKTYLPFTAEELKPHFIADIDGQIAYYQKSADRYQLGVRSQHLTERKYYPFMFLHKRAG